MTFRTLALASATTLIALSSAVGCDNEPAEGKTKVAAQEAVEAPAPAKEDAAVSFAINNQNASIDFVGAKVTAKHEGKFKDFSGTINLVDGAVEKSNVTVTIQISSLEIEPEKLRGHLLSPDLFDAEKFPTAVFTSTSIKAGGQDGATHEVTGNLELHGVKKSISFPAKIKATPSGATMDAEFAINRKDFGIIYPGMPDDLIKDDVLLKLKIDAKKS